jgi:hypothetical protein
MWGDVWQYRLIGNGAEPWYRSLSGGIHGKGIEIAMLFSRAVPPGDRLDEWIDGHYSSQEGTVKASCPKGYNATHTVTNDDGRPTYPCVAGDGEHFPGPQIEAIGVATSAIAVPGEVESNDTATDAEERCDMIPPTSMRRSAMY